jgi:Zn-dependent peptidase ImmA (M78 family)
MSSQLININREVLKWARESAHLKLHEVPGSIISTDKLAEIEAGITLPNFTQLQKMAKKYGRSLGALMANTIPEDDYLSIPFFRKENKTGYDSSLTLFLRDIQDKQDWARNYLISEGNIALDFIGSVGTSDLVENVALKIKKRLEFPLYNSFSNNEKYLQAIRQAFEDHNIFISITGSNQSNKSISIEQAQGFAISDPYAPFVFVNTKLTSNAKIFTLVHEVVHLFLNESGISEDSIRFRKPSCKEDRIENFCNEVAGEILMPEEPFIVEYHKSNGNLEERIRRVSKTFLVSELAVCVKLWRLKLLTFQEYEDVFLTIQTRIINYLKNKEEKQSENEGGGNYYYTMRMKNGLLLSYLAYSAYKAGNILNMDLGNILNIKTNHIEQYFSKI